MMFLFTVEHKKGNFGFVASLLLLTTVSKHVGTDVTNFRERNVVLLLFHITSSCSTALGVFFAVFLVY